MQTRVDEAVATAGPASRTLGAEVAVRSRESARQTLDIVVLAGGPGAEREVSLQSGRAVGEALRRRGHRVLLRDVGPDDLAALDEPADVVFIALHGEFGEDGTLQRILGERGIRYCGSDAASSALAMDKVATKRCFVQHGVPTPRFEHVVPERMAPVLRSWAGPAVVKPIASGSSVDTMIAESADERREAVAHVVQRYGAALMEAYIEGPELTVGVLDGVALPVCEIRTRRRFYDYRAKYEDNDTRYLFENLAVPDEILAEVGRLSVVAGNAVGGRDFLRVDWMVDAARIRPYALEINTIPGFTSHSLLPKAAARVGIDFDTLCARIVELAMRRAPECRHGPSKT